MENQIEAGLKSALNQAIENFNNNRSAILKLAYDTGGQEKVREAEQEYDSLRDSYFEILKKELDKNNSLYEELINTANTETEKLLASVKQLNNINEIINLVSSVINLVGRVLTVLGI